MSKSLFLSKFASINNDDLPYFFLYLGLLDNMKQLDQKNYSINAEQFVELAASLGAFFEQTGLMRQTASQASADLRARGKLSLSQVVYSRLKSRSREH